MSARLRAFTRAMVVSGLALLSACGGEEASAGHGGSSGPVTAAPADDPIAFADVPAFTLIDQDGDELTDADLAGRPYVVACIFTMCMGPCPSITKEMAKVVRRLDDVDVRFVSLSVDPARDHPLMLKRYADKHEADTQRWSFVTGEEQAIGALVRDGFKLPFAKLDEPDPETGDTLTHDQRLTVVDGRGRIRGWYDSQDADQVELLIERVRFLAGEE